MTLINLRYYCCIGPIVAGHRSRISQITNANLETISAVTARDIWAIGSSGNSNEGSTQTLILHWDGFNWDRVTSPNLGKAYNVLHDISIGSADDIWAVGSYSNAAYTDQDRTMILHWNGSQWSVVPSPNGNLDHNNTLFGTLAISKNDVWAVGSQVEIRNDFGHEPLTLHWDGVRWSIVPSPEPLDFQYFRRVSAVPNGMWAFGTTNNRERAIHWFSAQFQGSPCLKTPH